MSMKTNENCRENINKKNCAKRIKREKNNLFHKRLVACAQYDYDFKFY